ncbi:MAG: serine hydrolase domain-containing protein [Acidimicrobiales bacterium]
MRRALDHLDSWPVEIAAAAVISAAKKTPFVTDSAGPLSVELRWASITKIVTALAVLVAYEEGVLELDEPCGPPGATVRHLLAHASGLATEGNRVICAPGRRRIYSNAGFEVLAGHLEDRSGIPFTIYLEEAVFQPLGMASTRLDGSPASGAIGPLEDLVRVAEELLSPQTISKETLREATTVAFDGLDGVLPGFGRQEPNDWGLGVELRSEKHPHWTGSLCSPSTFGHFGQAGGFIWVDPERRLACASLSNRNFGAWAALRWPKLSDAVLAEHQSTYG